MYHIRIYIYGYVFHNNHKLQKKEEIHFLLNCDNHIDSNNISHPNEKYYFCLEDTNHEDNDSLYYYCLLNGHLHYIDQNIIIDSNK